MNTYMQTERSGQTTLHISLIPDPFFFSLLTMCEIKFEKTRITREQTESKTPKPTSKEAQNVQNTSNFKEYHRRAHLGTH